MSKRLLPWQRSWPGVPGPFVRRPPHIDDPENELPPDDPPPDWTPDTTRVVRVPNARFREGWEAHRYFREKYGRLFQNLSDARWWAARVKR